MGKDGGLPCLTVDRKPITILVLQEARWPIPHELRLLPLHRWLGYETDSMQGGRGLRGFWLCEQDVDSPETAEVSEGESGRSYSSRHAKIRSCRFGWAVFKYLCFYT